MCCETCVNEFPVWNWEYQQRKLRVSSNKTYKILKFSSPVFSTENGRKSFEIVTTFEEE